MLARWCPQASSSVSWARSAGGMGLAHGRQQVCVCLHGADSPPPPPPWGPPVPGAIPTCSPHAWQPQAWGHARQPCACSTHPCHDPLHACCAVQPARALPAHFASASDACSTMHACHNTQARV